ncbi:MAG: hypothetical protein ACQEXQ_29650 [Bacillota bacterium]
MNKGKIALSTLLIVLGLVTAVSSVSARMNDDPPVCVNSDDNPTECPTA